MVYLRATSDSRQLAGNRRLRDRESPARIRIDSDKRDTKGLVPVLSRLLELGITPRPMVGSLFAGITAHLGKGYRTVSSSRPGASDYDTANPKRAP